MGGLYVRVYERSFPGEAVGMVLVDSVSGAEVSLEDRPLVVLTQATSKLPEGSADSWTSVGARLAKLSTNSALVMAEESGHFIEQDQPELVAAAIEEVVRAARDGGGLRSCEETFTPLDGKCLSG